MNSEAVVELYASLGSKQYVGEAVNQIEHAWQCGRLAANAGASPSLQLAAWLHDIGHLIADLPGSPSADGIDDGHEYLGAAALAKIWGDEVAEPVRLHVLAKRFLVTTKPAYRSKLSEDSVRSLALQGGPMNDEELIAFRKNPYGEQAVSIRVWDDLAKSVEPRVPLSLTDKLDQLRFLMTAVSHAK
jgi:phosphonate degradation associated HDIG domain protein